MGTAHVNEDGAEVIARSGPVIGHRFSGAPAPCGRAPARPGLIGFSSIVTRLAFRRCLWLLFCGRAHA
jgi:hypothetical protein